MSECNKNDVSLNFKIRKNSGCKFKFFLDKVLHSAAETRANMFEIWKKLLT